MIQCEESLPLVDDGLSPTAPIASPDCMEEVPITPKAQTESAGGWPMF